MSLKDKISTLPKKPGVYQYFDKNGKILYVGKAKNLKNRVSSYFVKNQESGKTRILVRQIADLKFIVVDTELDALLLENSLIKEFQPKYNIMLKDDKTYPWICIKNEAFPRVFSTRVVTKDGSEYFGPYASGKMMKTILDLIRQIYPLRNCNHKLTPENIQADKFKVCLEYHIGNCLGGCVGKETEADYLVKIKDIREIIKGNVNGVIKSLYALLNEFTVKLDFEKCQLIKEKIDLLENYQSKSTVVSPTINNVDVFGITSDIKSAYVNYLKIVNGAIVQGHTVEIKKKLEEDDKDLLQHAIIDLRERFKSDSKEIILGLDVDIKDENLTYKIPQRGEKKTLLELSERNAKYFMLNKHKQEKIKDPEKSANRILTTIQNDLRLKELPTHIECFDNSNFQGTNAVAACVVFKNGKPAKKDYRHFNIKTVEGPDDFASMEEVVYRRYKRLKDEILPLPQLIVIDGGKGQLSSAVKALNKLDLIGQIAIIGIAKKLEEIYFPGDSLPIYIDKRSESLKVIQHLRNEAHRFGITHHRNKRSKGALENKLTKIEGIGENTANKLLKYFKSVKRVSEASLEDLEKVVGKSKAKLVFGKV